MNLRNRFARATAVACLVLLATICMPALAPAAERSTIASDSTDATLAAGQMRIGADAGPNFGVRGARFVELDVPATASKRPAPFVVTGVALTSGDLAEFRLQPFDVFSPDARIVAMANGVERPLAGPTVRLYSGPAADGDGTMFLAVDGSSIHAVIRRGVESWVIVPWGAGSSHVIAPVSAEPHSPSPTPCSADLLPENQRFLESWNEAAKIATPLSTTLLQADLMLDVNNSLYSAVFGNSTTTTTNYMTTLIGAATAIYQRDLLIRLRITSLTIWTTSDPFAGANSSAQLAAYKSYCTTNRTGVPRTIAHLFANGNVTNFGGIAYLGVLCNGTFGYGVSNIYGNNVFPQSGYTWDIEVTSHEMGHNFGSPHTHCFSPPIDMCYGSEAGCYTGPSIATLGTIMSYCHLTSGGISLFFHQRCIDVMRPTAESSCMTPIGVTNRDTVGVYLGGQSTYFLRNSHMPGNADAGFNFGPGAQGWVPLMGDWNNDGIDTPGIYSPSTGTFFLRNSLSPGSADLTFGFGPGGSAWTPIVGDWNGDGIDTIGIYNSSTGGFFLRNSNTAGVADKTFFFGPGNQGYRPVAGDWNGDGIDTVGIYSSSQAVFYLRNYHTGGTADVTVSYGPSGQNWVPVVGDWNGDGIASIGLYAPDTGTFFLRNTNSPGSADLVYSFGSANNTPLAGNWDGL